MVINWRSRKGWFRVWLLLALAWSVFAIWNSLDPWSVSRYAYPSINVVGQSAATSYIASAPRDVDGCMSGSVIRRIESPAVVDLPPGAIHRAFVKSMNEDAANTNQSSIESSISDQIVDDAILASRFGVSGDTIAANRRHYEQQAAAADAQAASQYIVHVSCLRTADFQQQFASDVGFAILPSLIIPVLGCILYVTVSQVGRWVLAGFQQKDSGNFERHRKNVELFDEPPEPPPYVDTQHNDIGVGHSAKTERRRARMSSPMTWVAIALILVVGATLTRIEKDFTHRAMGRILSQSDTDRDKSLERKLKSELPKAVSANVTAVDVAVDDGGIHWVYQAALRKTAISDAEAISALDTMPVVACKQPLIRLMTAKGFQVSYRLIDKDGSPLGSRTVTRCT
jgi:hypothetical protein